MSCFWANYLNTSEPDCERAFSHLYFSPGMYFPNSGGGPWGTFLDAFGATSAPAFAGMLVTKVQVYDTPASSNCSLWGAWANGNGSATPGAPGCTAWTCVGSESPPISSLRATYNGLSHSCSTLADVKTYALGLNGEAHAYGNIYIASITTSIGAGIWVFSDIDAGCS